MYWMQCLYSQGHLTIHLEDVLLTATVALAQSQIISRRKTSSKYVSS